MKSSAKPGAAATAPAAVAPSVLTTKSGSAAAKQQGRVLDVSFETDYPKDSDVKVGRTQERSQRGTNPPFIARWMDRCSPAASPRCYSRLLSTWRRLVALTRPLSLEIRLRDD